MQETNVKKANEITRKVTRPDFMNMTMGEMMDYAQAESDRMMAKVENGIKGLKRAIMGLFALNLITLFIVLLG